MIGDDFFLSLKKQSLSYWVWISFETFVCSVPVQIFPLRYAMELILFLGSYNPNCPACHVWLANNKPTIHRTRQNDGKTMYH